MAFMRLIVSMVLSFAAIAESSAQEIVWSPPTGPFGGAVQALALSDAGSIFAGAAHGLWRSADDGLTWSPIHRAIRDSSIWILGGDSSAFYAGTRAGMLFRTMDDGVSWQRLDSFARMTNALAITRSGAVFVGTSTGAFRSTDRGETWTRVLDSIYVNSATLGPDGAVYLGADGGIYSTTNDGATWTKMELARPPFPGDNPDVAKQVAFGPDGAIYYVGSIFRSYRSTDHGATWSRVTLPDGEYREIRFIHITASGTLVAADLTHAYRSSDGGRSWDSTGYSLLPPQPGLNPVPAILFASLETPAGTVLLATYGGPYRSTDDGRVWTESFTGMIATDPRDLLVDDDGTVHAPGRRINRSTDDCATWTPTPLLISPFAMHRTPSGRWLFGLSNGIAISDDSGRTARSVFAGGTFTAFAHLPDGTLFARAREPGRLHRSVDNGLTWKRVDQLDFVDDVIGPTSQGVVVLAGGLWRTVHADSPFVRIGRVFLSGLGAIAEAPGGDFLVASNGLGIRRVRRGSWDTTTILSAPHAFTAILPISDNDIVVASSDSGIWRSTNAGVTWQRSSSGLEVAGVIGLARHPSGYLLAATQGSGVVRSRDVIAAAPDTRSRSTSLTIESVRRIGEWLEVSLSPGSTIQLTVSFVTMSGQRLWSKEVAREHSSDLHVRVPELASGVYLLTISNGTEVVSSPVVVTR